MHFVSRFDNLPDILTEIDSWKERGVDVETSGLTEDDSLFSISVSNGEQAYYFNFNDKAPETPPEYILDRKSTCDSLKPILANPDGITDIANAKFDLRMLAKEGIFIQGTVHCTQAIERVVQNNLLGKDPYGLKSQAERRGLQKDAAVEEYILKHKLFVDRNIPGKKKKWRDKFFWKVPFPVMAPYASQDAILHAKVGRDQRSEILRLDREGAGSFPPLYPIMENERRLTKTCFRMERAGIKIDRAYVEKAFQYETSQIDAQKSAFEQMTNRQYEDSRKLLQEVFDSLGEPYPTTEKGNASFAADVLEEMETPVAQVVNRIRYHEKRRGTYYSSFLHYADKHDIIHPSMQQGGTETGRFSYRDPNLQNVPKEDDEEDLAIPYHVRTSFIPEPGHLFYAIDYKQKEYRILMDYAGQMDMIAAINEGEDVHEATARLCSITRKQAKTLNFALLYGAGPGKIAKMLGITTYEAKKLIQLYFGRLPYVRRFISEVTAKGESRGWIFNRFGRRCHITSREFAYILPNHEIQGTCADVVKFAMPRIEEKLAELRASTSMRLQVHDELLFSSPKGEEDIVKHIVPIMENVYPALNGIRLECSIEHSYKAWGVRSMVKGMAV
jgi:DNA polymerase-1